MQPKKPLSNWTNLQDIFAANKGNGAQMNDKVYGGLESAGQTALDRLGSASSGFRQAADKQDRTKWNADGSRKYLGATGNTYDTTPNTSNVPYSVNPLGNAPNGRKVGYGEAENERNRLASDQADNAAKVAAGKFAGAQAATAAATTRSTASYQGPKTLKEYDPNIGSAIGDAAARIGASPAAQFGAAYQGTSAGGGELDRAMMGAEGGGARSEALQGKFGDLINQLRAEQAQASEYAGGISSTIDADAAAARGELPGLQTAQSLAQRASEDAATVAKNQAEREAYDRAWATDTQKFNRTRGNQIQRAYRPPNGTELPVYPTS